MGGYVRLLITVSNLLLYDGIFDVAFHEML